MQQAPLTNLRSAIKKLSYWLADLSGKNIKSCSHDTGKNSLQRMFKKWNQGQGRQSSKLAQKELCFAAFWNMHFNVITMCFITAIFCSCHLFVHCFCKKAYYSLGRSRTYLKDCFWLAGKTTGIVTQQCPYPWKQWKCRLKGTSAIRGLERCRSTDNLHQDIATNCMD